jgi:hypothetical protein
MGCTGSNNLAIGGRIQLLLRRNVFPAANQRASLNFTPNRLLLGVRLKKAHSANFAVQGIEAPVLKLQRAILRDSGISFRTRPHNAG